MGQAGYPPGLPAVFYNRPMPRLTRRQILAAAPFLAAAAPARLPIRRAVEFSMLPATIPVLERFQMARDEGFEAITLMQTGKSQLMPLVLVDKPGGTFWKTWDRNIRDHLLRNQLISSEDLSLYQITDSADEAVKIITRFYRNFHSTRFVKDLLVIRLKHTPGESVLAAMNRDFADIILEGKIKFIKPTPDEVANQEHLELKRIAFAFNRRDYGRLRQLIDVLNGM